MERDKARSDLMAAWDRIRMLEVTLGRVKDPASPPPAAEPETCGHPVSTPMRAGTSMPCPHSPPCPLPGTRYSEGYCVARSEYALAPAPRPRVDAEE
jgi:hypothetical protein